MHLTNYAINKKSKDYVRDNNNPSTGFSNANDKRFADESAHKRSLKSLYVLLKKMGYDVHKIQSGINDIVIKTIITSLPSLNHIYKSCQPEDVDNALCF
jgi:tubulin polyglutamylase TTLL6/13